MKRSTRTLILVAVLAAAALAVFFFFPASKTVTLEVLGQPITITTRARQVSGVLDEAGIVLGAGDEIVPPPDTRLKDGQTIVLSPAIQVNIWVEDSLTTLTTTDHIPAEWLAQAGITFGEDDKILINGEVQPPDWLVLYQDEVTVEVQRAHAITVQRGEEQWTLHSPAASLGQALWQAGITLSESDLLTPPAETPLTGNVTAQIIPGRQITVSADGETITAATSAKTVGAALAQIGLPLQGLDYSQPEEDDPLPEDGHITVVRVQEEVVINQETIPFETQFTALADVEIDNYKVSQAGQVGLKANASGCATRTAKKSPARWKMNGCCATRCPALRDTAPRLWCARRIPRTARLNIGARSKCMPLPTLPVIRQPTAATPTHRWDTRYKRGLLR